MGGYAAKCVFHANMLEGLIDSITEFGNIWVMWNTFTQVTTNIAYKVKLKYVNITCFKKSFDSFKSKRKW